MYVAYKKTRRYKGLSWAWMFIILFSTSVILAATTGQTPPMKMKVEMVGNDWVKADKFINAAKYAASQSSLPAKEVTMIIDSINAFQQELYKQLNPQFKLEDSLLKVKPKQ